MPARVSAVARGAGPAALAAELLGRVRAELPGDRRAGDRNQVLVAARLTGSNRRTVGMAIAVKS